MQKAALPREHSTLFRKVSCECSLAARPAVLPKDPTPHMMAAGRKKKGCRQSRVGTAARLSSETRELVAVTSC